MTQGEIILAQQARIEQLKHALSVGWSPYYINGIDARKLADEALATPDDLSALRAHDEKLLAPYQWRPIETAPKSKADGSCVHGIYLLGICPDPDTCNLESAICIIWWEPLMNGGKGLWYGEGGYEVFPTHWMPIPNAEAIEKGGV